MYKDIGIKVMVKVQRSLTLMLFERLSSLSKKSASPTVQKLSPRSFFIVKGK